MAAQLKKKLPEALVVGVCEIFLDKIIGIYFKEN